MTFYEVVILGNWGIGKSSLAKEFKRICQSRKYISTVVPLEALQSGTKLINAARSIVEGIFRDLPYPVDRFKKVVEYFDSIGVSILGMGIQFSRDTSKQTVSPQAFLHDIMINLWLDLRDKTEILVVLLDDLDNFMAVPEIIMTIKQTLSMDSILKKTKILFGITSTPKSWLELTSTKKHNPLSRYFLKRIELEPLTENELKETIVKTLSGTGFTFSPKVIEQVSRYTKGHPFEMQVLCYHLFNNQLERRVEIDVWEKALQGALNDMGNAIFDYLYNQASSDEARVLKVIAEAKGPISVKQVQELAQKGKLSVTPMNVTKYLQRLFEKRLINKSRRGLYIIDDFMFRTYLKIRTK